MRELWQDDLLYWIEHVAISGKLVVAVSNGTIYSYDAEGELLWENDVDAVSISISGDNVIAGCKSGEILEFDENGDVLWYYDVGEKIRKISSIGSRVCIATLKGKIILMEGEKILWEHKIGRKVDDIIISSDLHITAVSRDYLKGRVVFFDNAGNMLWSSKINTSIGEASLDVSSKWIVVGTLYGMYLFGKDGNRVWKSSVGGITSVAITSDGKHIAAGAVDNKAYLLNHEGDIVWRKALSDALRKVLITHNGQFVVCNDGKSVRVFDSKGATIWEFHEEVSAVDITPDLSKMVIGQEDGKITLFGKGD